MSLIPKMSCRKPLSVRLRTNIMTIFILIFCAFSGFIIWFNYQQNAKTALKAADRLMSDISGKIAERTEGYLQPMFSMADQSVELPSIHRKPERLTSPAVDYLMRALKSSPQILSFYIGFEDGDFFQIQSIPPIDDRIRSALNAPEGSRIAVRRIAGTGSDERSEFWEFLAEDHRVLGEKTNLNVTYDPRIRPWYSAATTSDAVILTAPYVFASSGEIGLTAARRFDAPVSGVFGADVTLIDLSEFLNEQQLSETTTLIIFDQQQNLIAHHSTAILNRSVRRGKSVGFSMAQVTDLEDPAMQALVAEFTEFGMSKKIRRIFEAGDQKYVGQITLMPLSSGATWYLAFLVPIDEFIGPIIKAGTWSLAISLITIALAIPLLVFAALLISRPLNALAKEADNIRAFRLEEPVTIRSNIREVQRLTASIATTKAALRTFARYVPRALVEQLVQSGETAEVGGQRRVITLMFTDITDFTTMVEDIRPEALMPQISRYLEELGGGIQKNGGTIDKYIGDAIMAFWNAPLPQENHARQACLAALECRRLSRTLNDHWMETGQPVFETRFGLHLGEAVVGNVGSSDRINYTAIGASVNLTARLEALNKHYGTQILVSEAVVNAVASDFLFRPVDRVMPKGVTRHYDIFELVGQVEQGLAVDGIPTITAAEESYYRRWRSAYETFQARNWSDAAAAFAALSDENPADKLAAQYAHRSAAFVRHPPPPEWDGTEVLQTK